MMMRPLPALTAAQLLPFLPGGGLTWTAPPVALPGHISFAQLRSLRFVPLISDLSGRWSIAR